MGLNTTEKDIEKENEPKSRTMEGTNPRNKELKRRPKEKENYILSK